jgi:hypothetical protein
LRVALPCERAIALRSCDGDAGRARSQCAHRLGGILGAHPRIHSAEGWFYRDVLCAAGEALGFTTRVVAPKTLVTSAEVAKLLARARKLVGSPWAKDQRDAALAAWGALLPAAAPAPRRR